MAQALHAAIGTPAKFSPLTIDGTAKVLVSDLVGGSVALNGRPDYDNATFVMYVGSNPVVSHGHTVAMPNPVGTIREMSRRAEVWVIDPRHTETARLATHHLASRPGTDYAVLAFLVRAVPRDGADREVLEHRTVDRDRLAAAVAPFTLDHTARVADVAPAELTRLLAGVRRAGRVAVETGTGVTMAAGANVTQWLTWALMIITGSMNQPGGAWFHPGFTHQLDVHELPVSPPDGSFGPGPRSRPETHAFLGEWPCAVLADEIAAGNIRAVLNLGGHLLTAFPETGSLVPALESLDVFATIEIIGNDTTAVSTHVLPTKDQLERADVTLWDFLSPRVAAQHTPAVIGAVGDRQSTWWVLAELGRRLGHELAGPNPEQNTDDAMLRGITRRARVPFDELVAQGWAETRRELPAPWVERHLDRLGGWRLAPGLLVEQLAELAAQFDQVAARREPPALVLVPRRQKRHLNSQLTYLGDDPEILIHPEDAAAAGVVHAGPVVVRSATGHLTGFATVDPAIRRGAVSVPPGHQGANVNALTNRNELDLVTGMALYSGFPVSVHPAGEALDGEALDGEASDGGGSDGGGSAVDG